MTRFLPRFLPAMLLILCGMAESASAASPRVVVSIPPVHSLVQGILQGVGQADLVYSGGQSPHHSSLTPSDVGRLHNADLVIWVGPELESGLRKAVAQLDNNRRLTLSRLQNLPLLQNREAGILTEHSEHGEHDHGEHEHGEQDSESGATAHHDETDPHLWLSATLATGIVDSVTERLIEIDPQNQSIYQDNAEQLKTRLKNWQTGARSTIDKVAGRQYMVFHDAYQYFENEFGLQPLAAVSLNPQRTAGAKRLKLLRQQVAAENVVCLFTEPQFEPDAAAVIVEGSDARLGVLDPVGAELTPGPDLWFELMDNLVDGFVECMG